jgi:hypothetical protein
VALLCTEAAGAASTHLPTTLTSRLPWRTPGATTVIAVWIEADREKTAAH